MTKRANQIVYWPGMHHAIRTIPYSCDQCNKIAPCHSNEPIIITKTPEYPFQYICADYFELKEQHYLSAVRFSGWIMLYHYPPSKFKNDSLINTCREIFTNYVTPEEISTDGGPQFTSQQFKQFLKIGPSNIIFLQPTIQNLIAEQNLLSNHQNE